MCTTVSTSNGYNSKLLYHWAPSRFVITGLETSDLLLTLKSRDSPRPLLSRFHPFFAKSTLFPPPTDDRDPRLPRRLPVRTSFFEKARARAEKVSAGAPDGDGESNGEDGDANGRPSQFQRGEKLVGRTSVSTLVVVPVWHTSSYLAKVYLFLRLLAKCIASFL